MGKNFEIGVWMTETLYGYDGTIPRERVKTYLEGALNDQSEHSVTVDLRDIIDAPTQQCTETFTGEVPCTNNTSTYDYLVNWFGDYFENCGITQSNDCDILITNAYGGAGAAVNNQFATAEAGDIEYLPSSYTIAGSGDEFDQMSTVLHEVGHCLQDHQYEHYVGWTYEHSGTKYGTPFCSPDYDQICKSEKPPQFKYRGEMRWSECCEDQMIHTG